MTDSQKLDDLQKRVKQIHTAQLIQAAVVVLGFIGVLSLPDLISKIKK